MSDHDHLPLLPRKLAVQQALDANDLMHAGLRTDLEAVPHARMAGHRLVEPLHHHSFQTSRARDMRRAAR